jgi:CubicO group peptidase (beta-lactamase class C family)
MTRDCGIVPAPTTVIRFELVADLLEGSLMADVDSRVVELAVESGFSGVIRIDRSGQEAWSAALGLADRRHKIANDIDTQFAIASGVKGLTALVVVSLIEAGDLSLDTLARGIGPWTAEVIAMRCLGDPDAFPATDLGVRLAAKQLGLPEDTRALTERSTRWRPSRSYATQHLWTALDHSVNAWPPIEGK